MNFIWAICIIFSLILILFSRDYLQKYSPANIFTLFWCGQIFIILLLFSNILILKYWGIIYILICVIFFNIGYINSKNIYKIKEKQIPVVEYNIKRTKYIYSLMLLLSIIGVLYSIKANGFNLFSITDFQSVLDMSHQNSVDRYSGEKASIIQRLFAINSCTTAIIGGFVYYIYSGKDKILSYLSIFPAIFSGLAEGAKMGIITTVFLYLIGIIVSAQLLNKEINITFKTLLYFVIGFIVFLGIMVLTMMFRIGRFNIDTMFTVFGRATTYVLGHLPAFDLWFTSQNENISELTMGGKTFFGITNSIGLLERKQGLYDTMTIIANDGSKTNVYSYFRIMIDDFGSIGSLFYMIIIGGISNIVYQNFKYKRKIFLNSTLMCGIYFFISWSFATSVFVYMTYVAMIVYLYIILRMIITKRIL